MLSNKLSLNIDNSNLSILFLYSLFCCISWTWQTGVSVLSNGPSKN